MGARILIGAFGDAGHAFPAIGLARALAADGHDVLVESWERWRGDAEAVGAGFAAAQQYVVFPTQDEQEAGSASASQAAEAILPLIDEFEPDLVISDILTLATSLAAEVRGVRRASLVPHLWPVHEHGMPFFAFGAPPPRTRLGRGLWRAASPLVDVGLRKGRDQLNAERKSLALPPIERLHGGLSESLVLLGTLPQLEYPREWPAEVRLIGPIGYERPFPDVDLPAGDGPLVLVAPSTAKDPEGRLIRRAFEALADQPIRVIASVNGHIPLKPVEVPANGRLVDWLSYSQVMAQASLVISHGGHGTVARALGLGVPVLATPIAGDMFETGVRLQWAGLGRSIPWRSCTPRMLRWTAAAMLGDGAYRRRASGVAEWLAANEPDRLASDAVLAAL